MATFEGTGVLRDTLTRRQRHELFVTTRGCRYPSAPIGAQPYRICFWGMGSTAGEVRSENVRGLMPAICFIQGGVAFA